jgi:DNA-binding beta-propeller fold protein YncE
LPTSARTRRPATPTAGISDECAAQWPVEQLGPPTYTGIVDSHAYKLAPVPWGVYVADAGANTISLVSWSGRVSTAAVLPPQPLQLPDDPAGIGLPACAGGLTYLFEPVPTDIELSWHGAFVSLLPGGPEDPSLGARGSVVKVDLSSGRSRTVGTGLLAATDVAVSPRGDVYVTELFGGRVSKLTRSGPVTVAEFDTPAAVEWHAGRLYVAHDAFGSGKISIVRG